MGKGRLVRLLLKLSRRGVTMVCGGGWKWVTSSVKSLGLKLWWTVSLHSVHPKSFYHENKDVGIDSGDGAGRGGMNRRTRQATG